MNAIEPPYRTATVVGLFFIVVSVGLSYQSIKPDIPGCPETASVTGPIGAAGPGPVVGQVLGSEPGSIALSVLSLLVLVASIAIFVRFRWTETATKAYTAIAVIVLAAFGGGALYYSNLACHNPSFGTISGLFGGAILLVGIILNEIPEQRYASEEARRD